MNEDLYVSAIKSKSHSSYTDTQQVTITPTLGAELLTDGALENWASATNLTSWGESVTGTSTITQEAAIVHGGSSAARFTIDASNSAANIQPSSLALTAQGWHRFVVWARAVSGAPAISFGPKSPPTPGMSLRTLDTTFREYTATRRQGTDTGCIFQRSTATSLEFVLDDLSIKRITLATCLATAKRMNNPNKIVKAALTMGDTNRVYMGGVAARIDNPLAPQNGLYAYHDGAQVFLDKQVAGVWTNLLAVTAAYAAGAYVEIRCNGTSVELYYGGTQRGATQTVSDATVISNLWFSRFATENGARLDNLSIQPV